MCDPDHHAEMEAHCARAQHRADAQHAAEIVCHEEQMTIWTDEIIGHLSMGGYLNDGITYETVLTIREDISRELKSIIENAFAHPALEPGQLNHEAETENERLREEARSWRAVAERLEDETQELLSLCEGEIRDQTNNRQASDKRSAAYAEGALRVARGIASRIKEKAHAR